MPTPLEEIQCKVSVNNLNGQIQTNVSIIKYQTSWYAIKVSILNI